MAGELSLKHRGDHVLRVIRRLEIVARLIEELGEDTARELKSQRDTAKALFSGVAQAFRGNH